MIPYLPKDSPFPAVSMALDDPNGLLAAGADLSSERLIEAYSQGIFPWYSEGEPLLWWSPDPRMVFIIDDFKIKKSVCKTLKKHALTVTLNTAFEAVINACTLPRKDEEGTWITDEMLAAYLQLHHLGYAHSVEVWQQQKLVGGIYGVAVGEVFCGESMFSDISNGSKIALSCLIKYLKNYHFSLIDCQVESPHLISLGAINISRDEYLTYIQQSQPYISKQIWQPQTLNWQQLLKPLQSIQSNAGAYV